MPKLRLNQTSLAENRYRVDLELEREGYAPLTVVAPFEFELSDLDRERIRWYLEDFLQYPQDPAPQIADGVVARMAEIGVQLFDAVFHANDDARDLYTPLREGIKDTRVEVSAAAEGDTDIPWELLRDPRMDKPLSLEAQAFVRTHHGALTSVKLPPLAEQGKDRVRVLLAICRPGGRDDVPFRSVASHLIKGLNQEARKLFDLDVLRPATYDRLAEKLQQAKADGKPYHIVHFDGHGAYLDMKGLLENVEDKTGQALMEALAEMLDLGTNVLSPKVLYPKAPAKGKHGYLLFENPLFEHNTRFVDAEEMRSLLKANDVPVLVLNACRSAHADLALEPGTAKPDDPHDKIKAFGSFAQQVVDAGVAGVVAMRYNVFVVTAAQFVANLYAALAHGHSLGEAVSMGRKQLADAPLRTIAFDPRPLQDWCVPVVYEAAPIALFLKPKKTAEKLAITVAGAGAAAADGEGLDAKLPKRPDPGFFGRDETLLALDRAFDTHHVVLLHAFAGSGKTATAAEFARWYHLTGGLENGAVLFSSFERKTTLRDVLSHFGRLFGPVVEQAGIPWSALTDTGKMRALALDVLAQVPVLWIWDNVEPVAGFPEGAKSEWSDDERRELKDFLKDAGDVGARFLLTSRRAEQKWLHDLPVRVKVPPMPMQERVQLAQALAEHYGRTLTAVDDWRPLLEFTQGNPLTLTVLVGQALRGNIRTKPQVEEFVAQLRAGEAVFDDVEEEGRSASLGASLGYGFDHAFSQQEQKQMALLHLFQGFVNVDALKWMGTEKADFCVPEVKGLTREQGIALLDRAAEVGLLTAYGGGYYAIHPALPWFFKRLFGEHYPGDTALRARRAYAHAVGALGNYCHAQFEQGKRGVISMLEAEEDNLLHARQLARTQGWWGVVISAMQGLHTLYDLTGRRADWRRLVDEIVPDFLHPQTDAPIAGREEESSMIMGYRVRLARQDLDWPEAERLQRRKVESARKQAEVLLAKDPNDLDAGERSRIRSLGVALHELGQVLREQGSVACVGLYEESLRLAEHIANAVGAGVCAFNLGTAYKDLNGLRDLDKADAWYRRSLRLRAKDDSLGRGKCQNQLGHVELERFWDAREAGRPQHEMLDHLNQAARYHNDVLDLLPANAVADRVVTHAQLGIIYSNAGDLDRALPHYREAIRLAEQMGDVYTAAKQRFNVALHLAASGRFDEALAYARAALDNCQTFGPRAAAQAEETQSLIADILADMAAQKGGA